MIIGIIGGGQLGMMMAEAAKKYQHTIIGLDPNSLCPLSYVADDIIVSEYSDVSAISKLIETCDVVTYEFENVDLELIKKYENKIPQRSDALHFSKNRLIEKEFAKNLNIKTPRFFRYVNQKVLIPSIIKTTTGGYDGKGQFKIMSQSDIDQFKLNKNTEYIVEEYIDFDYEISVVATRDQYGKKVYYPVPRNTHKNGVLFLSEALNDIDGLIVSKAINSTSLILDKLKYIGTLAVEYFVKDNDVIFNEFAPRPHNSGHYTIEGCTVSQFENHILAITGEKIKDSTLVNPSIMINVLGKDKDYIKRINSSNIFYHDYLKYEARSNRKMGHITIVSETKSDTISKRNSIIEGQL